MQSSSPLKNYFASKSDLLTAQKKRDNFSNKYKNGRVLIIGGSSQYYGAPIMTINAAHQSLAALRVGAGYVKAFVPESILKTARSLSPNTIIQKLGKNQIEFNNEIKKEIEKTDVIVIGMGIGAKSANVAKKIIEYSLKSGKKVIADADAISAIKKINIKQQNQILITPHDGEFYKLTGKRLSSTNLKSRIKESVNAAKKYKVTILLKGHDTIITDGRLIKINKAKTAALATMGAGDVLSGIIGGYTAIGNDLYSAAVASVYLHSNIGDILYKKRRRNIIATDIIDNIGHVK